MEVKCTLDAKETRESILDTLAPAGAPKALTSSQIEDLRLAASKMNGVERRAFINRNYSIYG
ncbi:hypothetical protein [Brasilonema bromeliae]|uniref:Uncharacterized protein n=1 Tax=Brasilonema bromeliae SPC951 TaxID=385972 RepID=A0ABX1P7D1_9CYAN|nr:hypothetical protein [Brasilonema bromeliae]NMG19412.1 hypothetical protein [Brasilonema bromeliae SPC951]